MKKQILVFLACGWLLHCEANAQSVGPSIVNTMGGGGFSNGYNFDWSVGEMTMVNTVTSPTITVTHGVLQPHPVPTGIKSTTPDIGTLQVYPNPASDMVILAPKFNMAGKLGAALYDVAGKLLVDRTFTLTAGNEEQQLPVHALPSGQYTLIVIFTSGQHFAQNNFNIQIVK